MVEFGTEKDIVKEINETMKMIKLEKNNSTGIALYNYIGNLYSALSVIRGREVYPSKRKIFGSLNDYRRFVKITDFLMDRFNDNFIFYKDFHQEYLNDILVEIEDNFINTLDEEMATYSDESDYFGVNDFCLIFLDFCKSLGLEKFADEILKDGKIFCMTKGNGPDNYLGINLHNPLTGNSHILVHNFDYDLDSLFILVHETGHYYDLSEFDSSFKGTEYINYMFKSVYPEVMSKLFERLLLNFLIKNNIVKEKAIDKKIDAEILNHENILGAYILSLLGDGYLVKNRYMNLSNDRLRELITSGFVNMENLDVEVEYLNLNDNVYYAYGSIISLFLEDEVLEDGFNSSLMRRFMDIRSQEFNEKFIEGEELLSGKFSKIYQKRLEIIK
ncbi:MAG: oligoendopeptidase F family protein [Bacilli bacterium]|nr:oligoendopeptidase F family protein [Bacilli bacterium]